MPADRFRTSPGHRRAPRARRSAALVALAGLIALTSALSACSDKPEDPAQARLDRVETRLRHSFSARQAQCIVDQLDAPVLRALDRKADLTTEDPALAQYSAALQVCVNGGGTTTTTRSSTSAGATSTTPPATSTTHG
jgi:hypothetical protein